MLISETITEITAMIFKQIITMESSLHRPFLQLEVV